jgi:hypothetical protein
MIRPLLLAMAVLGLTACSSKYPDYEDLETQPYYSNLRDTFQRAPASRVSFQSLDGLASPQRSRTPARRRPSAVVVRPLPNATTAPTPLIQQNGG